MENLTLHRISSTNEGTFGVITRAGLPLCLTCELPWRDNKTGVSCIPAEIYPVTRWTSPSKGEVFKLLNTTPREDILIHVANKPTELRGCIAVGKQFARFQGVQGISLSRDTMTSLLQNLPDKFNLDIRNSYASVL